MRTQCGRCQNWVHGGGLVGPQVLPSSHEKYVKLSTANMVARPWEERCYLGGLCGIPLLSSRPGKGLSLPSPHLWSQNNNRQQRVLSHCYQRLPHHFLSSFNVTISVLGDSHKVCVLILLGSRAAWHFQVPAALGPGSSQVPPFHVPQSSQGTATTTSRHIPTSQCSWLGITGTVWAE